MRWVKPQPKQRFRNPRHMFVHHLIATEDCTDYYAFLLARFCEHHIGPGGISPYGKAPDPDWVWIWSGPIHGALKVEFGFLHATDMEKFKSVLPEGVA